MYILSLPLSTINMVYIIYRLIYDMGCTAANSENIDVKSTNNQRQQLLTLEKCLLLFIIGFVVLPLCARTISTHPASICMNVTEANASSSSDVAIRWSSIDSIRNSATRTWSWLNEMCGRSCHHRRRWLRRWQRSRF